MQSTAGSKQYGTGLRVTVNRINKEEMLNSPNDKKLAKSTIYDAGCSGGLWCIAIKEWLTRSDPPRADAWFSMPFHNDASVTRRGGLVVKNESNFVGNYAWNQI